MLLETLDIKENDIIIYSKNVFNPDSNFRIIFKDDPKKTPRKISYGDVCRFVNEFTPKNLIAYRLLTNIKNLEINSTKYGFFLYVNGVTELIYFDPVYAVKDLEEIVKEIDKKDLRFRIQQVGLTVLNRKENLPNFAEIYSIDLEAREAKFQNDKAFVEAIFSNIKRGRIKPIPEKKAAASVKKEPAPVPKEKANQKEQKIVPQEPEELQDKKETKETIKFINHTIAEDKEFDYKQIMKINSRKAKHAEEGYAFPKAVVESKKSGSLKDYLTKGRGAKQSEANANDRNIFKSPDSLKKIAEGKENKKIVLRMR